MKKTVSLLLTVCMCLSVVVMLTACDDEEQTPTNDEQTSAAGEEQTSAAGEEQTSAAGEEQTSAAEEEHTHTYKTEWTTDAMHHWHACEGADCADVADKAEHTWDEGVITTPATAQADGVKTFTCTVCGQTKTESVKLANTITKEEWIACLMADNITASCFANDALLMILYRDGNVFEARNENGQAVLPWTGQTTLPNGQPVQDLPYILIDETWYILVETDGAVVLNKNYIAPAMFMYSTPAQMVFLSTNVEYLGTLYENLSYNEATKEYELMPDALDHDLSYDPDIEYYRFYCEGGKIVSLTVKNTEISGNNILKLVYKDWDSTSIKVPEYTVVE